MQLSRIYHRKALRRPQTCQLARGNASSTISAPTAPSRRGSTAPPFLVSTSGRQSPTPMPTGGPEVSSSRRSRACTLAGSPTARLPTRSGTTTLRSLVLEWAALVLVPRALQPLDRLQLRLRLLRPPERPQRRRQRVAASLPNTDSE